MQSRSTVHSQSDPRTHKHVGKSYKSCSALEAVNVCTDHKTHIIGILAFIQGPQKGAMKIMTYNRPRIKRGSLQSTQWNV